MSWDGRWAPQALTQQTTNSKGLLQGGKGEENNLIPVQQTIALTNIPTYFSVSMQGSCTFYFPLVRGENAEESETTQSSLSRALIAAPRWVPKPPNRMLLCIISKAQLSMSINEKHCCATNLSGLVLAEFLGWKSHSSHNCSVHPAA